MEYLYDCVRTYFTKNSWTKEVAPPAANGGLPRRKIFSFICLSPCPTFSFKKERKFFCSAFIPSQTKKKEERRGGARARGRKVSFPLHSLFTFRPLAGFWREVFERNKAI
ncbi:MAG: hypothetical protein A2672_03050 [Candidatus Wildermuthbacteria bacterium RIFCSPHIGHO2_01_FULL_49_22b]|uniref:Uncharacterized protein n=1 Tax=Candidatus Wildermuthbacteria bacterium RIFCSPHIGHO2_01_FULL_49_22b TaxID=1802448 RepID=A0A1G2QZ97_9BACT|nr:MAG: hypothetical protein A2672_03050 [Candidatus Wildermuthbacteria bacterium RIFCSPHIGHO2_01_FULL_49_22b]